MFTVFMQGGKMGLGQMMLVIGGIVILGIVVLTANSSLIESTDVMNDSEFGITAVSLATSLVEEASGKMFDSVIADSTSIQLTNPSQLSTTLGAETGEVYRSATHDYDDFDDFNNIFLVFKSDNPRDTIHTTGSTWETIVPGIRSKYFVRARVTYVPYTNLDSTSAVKTWHKKIVVTVTRPQPNPTRADTLVFPAVLSYWN
jgi:hypothetical protein